MIGKRHARFAGLASAEENLFCQLVPAHSRAEWFRINNIERIKILNYAFDVPRITSAEKVLGNVRFGIWVDFVWADCYVAALVRHDDPKGLARIHGVIAGVWRGGRGRKQRAGRVLARTLVYHMHIMAQAGLIEASLMQHMSGMIGSAQRLTWDGHEFLDRIREQTTWNRVKATAREKSVSLTFEVVSALAAALAKQSLGLPP